MSQAAITAKTYLSEAVKAIDEEFGAGYAEQHPLLVGRFMTVAAADMAAATSAATQQELAEAVGKVGAAVEDLARQVDLELVSAALTTVASAINNLQ
jgi:hypothetical protein